MHQNEQYIFTEKILGFPTTLKELYLGLNIRNDRFMVSFPVFLPSHLCVDIFIQVLINECMQLSPWGSCLNPCTAKKLEEAELKHPRKRLAFPSLTSQAKNEITVLLFSVCNCLYSLNVHELLQNLLMGQESISEDGERATHESPSTGRGKRNKEMAMDSKAINQCRNYAIPFYDERSSVDLDKEWNEPKKVEAKLEGSIRERWKRVKLAGPSWSWCPKGERRGRH